MQSSAPRERGVAHSFSDFDTRITAIRGGKEEKAADPELLQQYIISAFNEAGQKKDFDFKSFYSKLQDYVRIHLDLLDGVKAKIVEDEKYPTGIAYYRDATNALPLDKRLKLDHPIIKTENLLLRCLNALRGIDFVLAKRNLTEERVALMQCLMLLLAEVNQYQYEISQGKKPKHSLKEISKNFNTELIKILFKNGLDKDISVEKDYEKLLGLYSDLSCVIDPAKSFVTVSKHVCKNEKKEDVEVIHEETADPVTVKTDKQIQQIDELKALAVSPRKESRADEKESTASLPNIHVEQPKAFLSTLAEFAERIKDPKTLLPAQARNIVAISAKNTFLSRYRLIFNKPAGKEKKSDKTKEDIAETCTFRSGSLVYVGSGVKKKNAKKELAYEQQLMEYTEENIKQMMAAIPKSTDKTQLHFTMLITDSDANQQDIMLKISKGAGDKLGCIYSYVPTNAGGVIRSSTVAPELQAQATKQGAPLPEGANLNKATRVANAAKISIFVAKTKNRINVVFCASGQDRTGTEEEEKSQCWAVEEYAKHGIKITQREMEGFRVLACHNVFLASHQRPGAPGLKKDSRVYFFHFSTETQHAIYRKEAEFNKGPAVDVSAVHRLRLVSFSQDRKDAKDSTISDDTIRNLAARIGSLCFIYQSKGKKNLDILKGLKNDVDTIFLDAEKKYSSPNEKLIAIADKLQKIWNAAAVKKANGAAYPKDELINRVNIDPSHTTSLRVGELLQELKDLFPKILAKFSISEHNQRIIPETLILRNVSDQQIENLKKQIFECQALSAPKKNETLDAIAENLKTIGSLTAIKKDDVFSKAIIAINDIWKQLSTDLYKTPEKGIRKLFAKGPDMFTKSDGVINLLNRVQSDDKYNYPRAIATILQEMNKEFGKGQNIIRPPIRNLEVIFEFKKDKTKTTSQSLTRSPHEE